MQLVLAFVMVVIGLAFALPAGAASDDASAKLYENHGFHFTRVEQQRLAPEEFAIMPWGWTPGDEQALGDIKECGFNLAGFVDPRHVKMVQKAGLKCIVDDPRISEAIPNVNITDAEIAKLVEEGANGLKSNPAVFGYYLRDEPSTGLYPALARWSAAIKKADPDALAYINLLPIGAQDPGAKSYEDYVESFIDTVKPTYVSYDHYTLMDDGSVRPSLFQNLEVMRKISLRHGIPYWNIVLANCHFRYATPTPGGLGLQVFSTLAYGGRGISYFTYFAPFIGNYRDAAVDQFLNKTPTWDMIRRINLQIHALGPTYMQLKSVNVFHHPDVPAGCSGIDTSKHIAEISGGNFLVGEFVHADGRPFVMVVNKDISTSTAFSVKFKQQGQVMFTNSYTGKLTPWSGENNWLAPGQGMLLSLAK